MASTMTTKALSMRSTASRPTRTSTRVVAPRAVLQIDTAKQADTVTSRITKATGLPAPKINNLAFPWAPGFTASNEVTVGRAAMLGFTAELIGELITHQGPLAQFATQTGLNTPEAEGLLLGLTVFNLVAAVLPASETFSPAAQEALKDRPAGPLQDPSITLLQPSRFFNITRWGFTPQNELFVGRVAQLGFLASVIGEVVTGKGALEQWQQLTGINPEWTLAGIASAVGLFLAAAIGGSSKPQRKGTVDGQ